MYDKSKKTWSQRLKISKTEKNTLATTASVTTNSTIHSAVGNNANVIGTQQHQLYQIQQFTNKSSNKSSVQYQAMHLPNALQFNDYQNIGVGYTTDYMNGTTSRAMKYSEPWIYSTVRGTPARPYYQMYHQQAPTSYPHPHAAAIFASPPLATTEALAVVICSCPEYLNGTKRDMKKASICKKCKGSRLPLATIGGVMPTTKLRTNGTGASATMRVVSMTKKSRPTILDHQKDPYDLMRRSRLLSPEPTTTPSAVINGKDKLRSRGKSISPPRGRTRTRHQLPPVTSSQKKSINNDLVPTTPNTKDVPDCWLVEDDETLLHGSDHTDDSSMMLSAGKVLTQSRRSILRYNVNPYDLISIKSNQETASLVSSEKPFATGNITNSSSKSKLSVGSQNEFMPPNDDDFNVEDAALNEDEPPFLIVAPSHTISNKSNNKKKKSADIGSGSIRINSDTKATTNPSMITTPTTTKANKKNNQNAGGCSTPRSSLTSPKAEEVICESCKGSTSSNSNSNSNSRSNSKSNSKSSISISSGSGSNENKLNYSNVQAIAGQRISLGKQKPSKKSLIKQNGDGHAYESIIIAGEDEEENIARPKEVPSMGSKEELEHNVSEDHTALVHQSQPKRPPRSKKQDSSDPVSESEMEQGAMQSTLGLVKSAATVTVLIVAPSPNIKSILKRPSSKSSNNGDTSNTEMNQDLDCTTAVLSITSHSQQQSTTSGGVNKTTASLSINQTPSPSVTSQFYIPLPQSRKKVQFMMEEKVVFHTDDENNGNATSDSSRRRPTRYKIKQEEDEESSEGEKEEKEEEEKFGENTNNNQNTDNGGEDDDDDDDDDGDDGDDDRNIEQSVNTNINYEYYNKKRQQKPNPSLTLDQSYKTQTNGSHRNNSSGSSNDSNPKNESSSAYTTDATVATGLQAAVLEKIQQESDLVSRTFHRIDAKICNDENYTECNIDMNENIDDSVTNDRAHLLQPNKTPDSRPDEIVINSMDKANCNSSSMITTTTRQKYQHKQQKQQKQQEKVTNSNGNKQHEQRIINQQNSRSENITSKRFSSSSEPSDEASSSLLLLPPSSTTTSTTSTTSAAPTLTSTSTSTSTFSSSTTTTMTTLTLSTTRIEGPSSALLMPSRILSPSQIKLEVDGQLAADATVASYDDTISEGSKVHINGDYDDVACKELQALSASDSTVRVTQSRNPIRRSHSERMPAAYSKVTSAGIEKSSADGSPKGRRNAHSKNGHSNDYGRKAPNGKGNSNINTNNSNNNNDNNKCNSSSSILGLNFKDTTALRIKSHHKDSRNLFAQNNSTAVATATVASTSSASLASTVRPKEPPPPPPPSSLTIVSPTISTGGADATSYEKVTENGRMLGGESPETTVTLTTTSSATTSGGCKENFLSLSPSLQAHSVDNDDREMRRKKQTFTPTPTPTPTPAPGIAFETIATTTMEATTEMPTGLVTLMRKSHNIASASGLDSQKEKQLQKIQEKEHQHQHQHQHQEQHQHQHQQQQEQQQYQQRQRQHEQKSLLDSAEALQTNVKNQRNSIDKSVLSRKCNTTSKAAALSETENNAVDDSTATKLILGEKPQQLPQTNHPPCPETTISTLASRTIPKANNNANNGNNNSGNNNSSNSNNNSFSNRTTALDSSRRTIVRVAPFNKSSSEVHRLKISHTDDNGPNEMAVMKNQEKGFNNIVHSTGLEGSESANNQKKTSILINGDDCYSTMNLSLDASTPIYQSSVVVADYSIQSTIVREATDETTATDDTLTYEGLKVTTTSNMVTINLSSPRSVQEDLIDQHNKVNRLRVRQAKATTVGGRAIIPIKATSTIETSLHRSASSTSSASTTSSSSGNISGSGSARDAAMNTCKRGRTLIKLDYEEQKVSPDAANEREVTATTPESNGHCDFMSHEAELLKILRNPVEAVKRNLVPHVCGRNEGKADGRENARNRKMKENGIHIDVSKQKTPPSDPAKETTVTDSTLLRAKDNTKKPLERNSFIAKLLEDPTLGQVADGLETDTVAELIENSLKRLKESRNAIDISGTKDNDDMNRLITLSLRRIQEERQTHLASMNSSSTSNSSNPNVVVPPKDDDRQSNRGSISSANSFASANNYEMFDFDANESDCYQSCSSEITTPGDDDVGTAETRSKFYQLVVDATLAEIELCTNMEEDNGEHLYESIRNNNDPIYEEITDVPPPLPLSEPPTNDTDLEKKSARSIFEGASKYDILSYLVDAKERGVVREESFEYPLNFSNPIIIEEEANDTLSDLGKRKLKKDLNHRASILSDSSEDNQSTMSSLSPPPHSYMCNSGSTDLLARKSASSNEIERNDSGVGSETSKCSRSKYQSPSGINGTIIPKNSPIHLCEDCDGPVETQVTDAGVIFAPLVCRKCGKKRVERKEIITEIVETEEKYGRDLQIILEEFYHPMLVAGLLTQEQLSAIFLNTEELLENNQTLAEKMRDALDIAIEQGDDDLLTVNIGRLFLDFTQMLHAFESYCVRQAGASLLLANLEKEKELLRIFLKVSQMENAVLRRMNLNSFLMVPVQRVTKYPLLLARLYKVTPTHLDGRDLLKQAQEKIELHLNHINQEAKDVPTKLWRRISSSSPNRRASCEIDMINIKLRKMAIDVLEWNHDEVRFVMEGKLLYTQPTDSNWKKARSIKLTPVNALLVTNGKPSGNYKAEKNMPDKLNFPKHTGIREASLLLVKEKCGRYTLIREPLYLDRCVVCSEADCDDYFEVQEILSKDTFIFKAEDGVRTKQWYTQLQYHAQGMGAWRKRRNALANIMINGMLTRS